MADGKDLDYVRGNSERCRRKPLTQDEREIQVETDGVGKPSWQWEAAIHARKTRSQIPSVICIAEPQL